MCHVGIIEFLLVYAMSFTGACGVVMSDVYILINNVGDMLHCGTPGLN